MRTMLRTVQKVVGCAGCVVLPAMMLASGAFAGTATGVTVNDVSVGDNTSGNGWKLEDNYIKLTSDDMSYTIRGTDRTNRLGLKIDGHSCTVFAIGLVLQPADSEDGHGAFVLMGDAKCTLVFSGECFFRSTEGFAGIEVQSDASLTIQNPHRTEGKLSALGGLYGAGIGGARNTRHPGEILIKCNDLGTIYAKGNHGAGIGGGTMHNDEEWSDVVGWKVKDVWHGGDCNKPIVIEGGNITAIGNDGSAGIGGGAGSHIIGADGKVYMDHLGGNCKDIRILGGRVLATVDTTVGATIGAGKWAKSSEGVCISGGTVILDSPGSGNLLGGDWGDRTIKEIAPVTITGGSIVMANILSPDQKVAGAVVDANSNEVYEVKLGPFTNGKVDLLPMNKFIDWDLVRFSYGSNSLYTDEEGYLHLYLPVGLYFGNSQAYSVVVADADNIVATMLRPVIFFDPGSGGSGQMNGLPCDVDRVYNLPECTMTAPRGKTFAGWLGQDGVLYDDRTAIFNLGTRGEKFVMTAAWE